jgi:hypothetical protein
MTATTPTPRVARADRGDAVHRAVDAARADAGKLTTYWLTMLGIYVMQGALWYYGAYEKIVGGDMKAPAGITKSFQGTFIDSFPGIDVAWGAIAIVEGLLVVGLAASLVRGEFLPSRAKTVLMGTLAGSLVVLGALLFGQAMVGEHDSVASLFTYGGVTLVMMAAVAALAPRSSFWARDES